MDDVITLTLTKDELRQLFRDVSVAIDAERRLLRTLFLSSQRREAECRGSLVRSAFLEKLGLTEYQLTHLVTDSTGALLRVNEVFAEQARRANRELDRLALAVLRQSREPLSVDAIAREIRRRLRRKVRGPPSETLAPRLRILESRGKLTSTMMNPYPGCSVPHYRLARG